MKKQNVGRRGDKIRLKSAVSYHKTLTYFFDRFHIENPAILNQSRISPDERPHS